MKNEKVYLPGLNGLRAIAALSVVIGHTLRGSINTFNLPFYYGFPMPAFSVTLFFVISGFLITYLLLKEKEISKINIKNFYIRRILRIWPLYYLYIIICIFLSFFNPSFQEVISSHIYWYIFFAAHICFVFGHVINIYGHLWSIGVEEQFYAFWPWVMRMNNNRLKSFIINSIIILAFSKALSYFVQGPDSKIYQLFSTLRFYSMLYGSLGAIYFYNYNRNFVRIFSNKYLQFVCWVSFILAGFDIIHIPSPIAHEFISVVSLVIIIGQITEKNKLVNLENIYCDFLGKISYGIYVLHSLILVLILPLLQFLPTSALAKSILALILVIMATIILAYLSYHYYESFFLRLKDRYTTVKTQSSDLQVLDKEYVIQ